ncbi:hypothetical protein [Chryseobacterium sp. 18068]|uniref:hypothetical protein n=1 Tax=Chryseobacterium sp. 18068 TaxID=2681414 RepID=UPI00135AB17C|nr:hypothetical protein [Chryseobacterium sp. 18068]
MSLQLTINAIFLVSEITMFTVFAGIVIAAGGGLYIFNGNKISSSRQSLAPNNNLINEKKAELLEYELKPKPSKVLANARSKMFDESLAKLDLEAMSQERMNKTESYQPKGYSEEILKDSVKKSVAEKKQKNLLKDISRIDDIINTR